MRRPYMTLQLLHSGFPYMWGKFYFIFYQCGGVMKSIPQEQNYISNKVVQSSLPLKNAFYLLILLLCTGGAYYVPYSCPLISNKFCNGGGSGPSSANKFLYEPAPPPPSVWALKPPWWVLVHKTTYAPIIYTALCIMFGCVIIYYLGKWEGVGPWNSRIY